MKDINYYVNRIAKLYFEGFSVKESIEIVKQEYKREN